MLLVGKAWKYGDHIDTDVIIPARYLNVSTPEELAQHCLEGLDPRFAKEVQPGDILVAGANFGCGSSREHAPLAIKATGVSCVIAESFARIFYRNAINVGLPVLECPEAIHVEMGDTLEVELTKGTIHNVDRGQVYQAKPYPEFILEIIEAGGLIAWIKQKIESNQDNYITRHGRNQSLPKEEESEAAGPPSAAPQPPNPQSPPILDLPSEMSERSAQSLPNFNERRCHHAF